MTERSEHEAPRGIMRAEGTNIIDRRGQDATKKSLTNRQRFFGRYRRTIARKLDDKFREQNLGEIGKGGVDITIDPKDMSEPTFEVDPKTGEWKRVYAGNDRFGKGDEVPRPLGGEGGSGKGGAGQGGETEDQFQFHLTEQEFLDMFFEGLALPNLTKKALAAAVEWMFRRSGFTLTGSPMSVHVGRTRIEGIKRRIAARGGLRERIAEIEAEIERTIAEEGSESERARALSEEIKVLRERSGPVLELEARLTALIEGGATEVEIEEAEEKLRDAMSEIAPFLDDHDFRYRRLVRVPLPSTRAVMFCLMDVSGSMDEEKKTNAKIFYFLLYRFLRLAYEHVEVVFLRHHTTAKEVSEREFFYSPESGGTVVSSVLKLMIEIARERYATGWNIYGAQASDGDNWDNDSPFCAELLINEIKPITQYFAYIEVTAGEEQNLWRAYEGVALKHPEWFAMKRIASREEVYQVFRDLFRKKGVAHE